MRIVRRALLASAVAPFVGNARAQPAFPSRSVRLIVPFPPGGAIDAIARELGSGLGAILKQPFVIENVGGAGGAIGISQAARAAPDGYTWGLTTAGAVAILPFVQKPQPYDPLRDLALVTRVATIPEILVISPSVPATDLSSLVAYLKANPGKLNYASSGIGSITHLAGELFKAEAQVNVEHIPYRGAAPALVDLLAGQVQIAVLDVPIVEQYVKSGQVRAIAITSNKRVQALPDVPSMAELGFPKVNSDNWFGLVGNGKIPAAIQQTMNAAVVTILNQPSTATSFSRFSAVPTPSSPAEFRAFLTSEQAKWSAIVSSTGIGQ